MFITHLISEPYLPGASELTHWGRDKMAAIFQTTCSNAFSWMKMYELWLRFHWSLFPRISINNIPALVQIMAWRQPGDKPLSEPIMVILLKHICLTRPQWVNVYIVWHILPLTLFGIKLWKMGKKWYKGNIFLLEPFNCFWNNALGTCSLFCGDFGVSRDLNSSSTFRRNGWKLGRLSFVGI